MDTLEFFPKYKIMVMGAGNVLRSDDGIGSLAARLLRDQNKWPDTVAVLEVGTAMFNYLQEISGSRCVIIIDAVRGGGKPGSIYRYEKWESLSSLQVCKDSHGLLPTDIIEWARALTGLPTEIVIFGVEPANLDFGSQISPSVMAALPALVSGLTLEINRILG